MKPFTAEVRVLGMDGFSKLRFPLGLRGAASDYHKNPFRDKESPSELCKPWQSKVGLMGSLIGVPGAHAELKQQLMKFPLRWNLLFRKKEILPVVEQHLFPGRASYFELVNLESMEFCAHT